jgi:hypothetical protein
MQAPPQIQINHINHYQEGGGRTQDACSEDEEHRVHFEAKGCCNHLIKGASDHDRLFRGEDDNPLYRLKGIEVELEHPTARKLC